VEGLKVSLELQTGQAVRIGSSATRTRFDREALKIVQGHLERVLRTIPAQGQRFIETTVQLPNARIPALVVETEPGDVIVYAKWYECEHYSRFVKGRKPAYTDRVSVLLEKSKQGDYRLNSALPGIIFPREEDLPGFYWEDHAFRWDPAAVIPGTVISEAQWLARQIAHEKQMAS
jgi:hypothetical protein